MSSYMHGSRVLELRSLDRVVKPADNEVKVEGNTKEGAVNPSGLGTDSSLELTLDDFGGRSDALGG
jgi:hypothetical protein